MPGKKRKCRYCRKPIARHRRGWIHLEGINPWYCYRNGVLDRSEFAQPGEGEE